MMNNRFKSGQLKHHDPIPEVEWWDIPYLHNQKSYFDQSLSQMDKEQQIDYLKQTISTLNQSPIVQRQNFYDLRKISRKLEDPQSLLNYSSNNNNNNTNNNNNNNNNVVIPMYLTKDEQKKIRKR